MDKDKIKNNWEEQRNAKLTEAIAKTDQLQVLSPLGEIEKLLSNEEYVLGADYVLSSATSQGKEGAPDLPTSE